MSCQSPCTPAAGAVIDRDSECPDRSDGHQKAFIKGLPVLNPLKCFYQDIVSNDKIGDEITEETKYPRNGQKAKPNKKRR